jgi:macrolide-specific efflux system membrane fusion protein
MYAQDATPRADLESAEAAYKTAQAQVKALDAQIESAKVTRSTAQTNIGYTRIVAPTDGTVVAIVTEEGQTVNANQSAPTIVKIAKLQNMTIKAQVSEADIMKVEKGQKVYFTTLGDDSKRYATYVRLTCTRFDLVNQTVPQVQQPAQLFTTTLYLMFQIQMANCVLI